MATAKKLKSGSWRCLVYDYTDSSGKRHYESFTARTKKEAELLAAQYAAEKKPRMKDIGNLTFAEALDNYISERTDIVSPSTIRKYRSMQRNRYDRINNVRLRDLNSDIIQRFINTTSASLSPKSVRDVHGLITAVLNRNDINIKLNTALPQKVHSNFYVPSDDDIYILINAAKNTEMELPILLAAFGPLRRAEISPLDASDLTGNVLHVHKNMAYDVDCNWIVKAPKSYAGDRYIVLPDFVCEKFPASGPVTTLLPNMITSRFEHLLKSCNLPSFRFHDLRHYNASIKHALGIPDAYIMQDGGWGNDRVLKEVYRHAMTNIQKEMSMISVKHFENMQHEMQHENEKAQ